MNIYSWHFIWIHLDLFSILACRSCFKTLALCFIVVVDVVFLTFLAFNFSDEHVTAELNTHFRNTSVLVGCLDDLWNKATV